MIRLRQTLGWHPEPYRCNSCDAYRATTEAHCPNCEEATESYLDDDADAISASYDDSMQHRYEAEAFRAAPVYGGML